MSLVFFSPPEYALMRPSHQQHCTLALPSSCTRNVTRNYFADGTLPPEGTLCPSDYPPFSDPRELMVGIDEEGQLLQAQALLGQILPLASHGLPYDHILTKAGL